MQPVRVWMLIQNFYPSTGGAERQCLNLSKALLGRGFKVKVITRCTPKNLAKDDIINDVPVMRIRAIRPFELAVWYWFFFLIKHSKEYDLLHVHMLDEQTLGAVCAGKLLKKPVIVKCANSGRCFDMDKLAKEGRWPFNRLIIRSVKYATPISISKAVHADLLRWKVPAAKIAMIPNGVVLQPPVSSVLKTAKRAELGLPSNACIVLRVGSYLPAKGALTLCKAWEKVVLRHKNCILVSVGGDRVPDDIRELAALYPTQARFILNQPDGVLAYYQAADIFVLPSLAEGLPNALLEAQACGLPAVATRVGGSVDIIANEVNGLLVEPEASAPLANAIMRLIEDKQLRNKMSANALLTAKKFSMDEVARQYSDLYGRLMKSCVPKRL